MKPLIVDALASGRRKRLTTRDTIGVGPRAVAGVLEKAGMSVKIILAEKILDGSIDVGTFDMLLVSGMTSDTTAVRRIVSIWKGKSSGPVVVGGPIASDPERIFRKIHGDLAVIGEGELTLMELLNAGLINCKIPNEGVLSKIRGIAYIESGNVHVNQLRPVMDRLTYDNLDPSTKTVLDYPLYRSARVYIEVLRGCSNYHRALMALPEGACEGCGVCRTGDLESRYDCPEGLPPGCGYCSVPSLYGPPKSRSVESILDEVDDLLTLGVRRLVLSAPGFLDYGRDLLVEPQPLTDPRNPEPNYEAVEELLSEINGLEKVSNGDVSVMIENLKGELVTQKAAFLLGRYLARTSVNIGFETGSYKQGIQIGRASTPRENLDAIKRLKRAGLKPYVYFIHGLPGQNLETVKATVIAIRDSVDAGASRIILYRFQPLPMSAFNSVPSAPPAKKDKLSKMIYDEARKANRSMKASLIGNNLRVVIAETYDRDPRFHVAYPMLHGPVTLIEGVNGLEGNIVTVEVTRVISDRMVRGSLIQASI